MANTFMTRDEVREKIGIPLLQAIRQDCINLEPGETRRFGMFEFVAPTESNEYAAWRTKLQEQFDETAYQMSLPLCPNCGQHAEFTEHTADHVETHGLDCGPYERWTETWLRCSNCGAETDDRELEPTNN